MAVFLALEAEDTRVLRVVLLVFRQNHVQLFLTDWRLLAVSGLVTHVSAVVAPDLHHWFHPWIH